MHPPPDAKRRPVAGPAILNIELGASTGDHGSTGVLQSVGCWVRCEREAAPAKGTWSRFAGKVGRAVTVNERDREIGVLFTASGDETTTWFRYDELVAVDRPTGAPNITARFERGSGRDAQAPDSGRELAGVAP